MTTTGEAIGAYAPGEVLATSRRFEWRAVSGEGSVELVAQLARDASGRASLALEARRVSALRDEVPWLLAPLLDAVPGEGGPTALVHGRARGGSLAAALPLDEARALALGAGLARLLRALDARGLALESLAPEDLRYDPATARATLAGLARILRAAGRVPELPVVAWGELLARVLGAPTTPRGWNLEALHSRGVSPRTSALVRDALRGDASALERAAALLSDADAQALAARELRSRAESGFEGVVTGPGGLVLELVGPLDEGHPEVAEDTITLGAIAARTNALVVVRTARLAPGASLDAVRAARARVEAEFERARADRAPLRTPLLRFRGPTLDAALARAPSPELRHDEVYAVYAWGSDLEAPAPAALPALARFSAAREDDAVRLAVTPRAAGKVAIVRARGGEALLLPSDGETVFAGDVPEAGVVAEDPASGETPRYAAFALGPSGEPGPALRARLATAHELEGFEATPGVQKVTLRWSAPPPGTRSVIVRVAPGEAPASPTAGALAYWGSQRTAIDVPGEAGQTLHARAFLLRDDGTLSHGTTASAEVWSPPAAVTNLAADATAERRVRLAWEWPRERARLSGARLRREPPFDDREVALDLAAAPTFTDEAPPIGVNVRYEVATISAGVEATSEVRTIAWAELAGFEAQGAGEAVALAWRLPEGTPPDARVRIVRRMDRAPADLDDGEAVTPAPEAHEHVDGPFPAGTEVFYRAGLVLAGGLARSSGRVAQARALEKAGALANLTLASKKRAIEVRWEEPPAGVDDVVLYAGPQGRDPVAYDRTAFLAGKPARVEAPGGVLQKIKAVPRLRGREDASGQVTGEGVAWDEVEGLQVRTAPGAVELAWTAPPATAQVVVRRRLDVKDAPWQELAVEPGATSLRDEPPRGKGCVYKVSLRFTVGATSVESDGLEKKEQSRELPPELGTPAPRARSAPGAVLVQYFEPKVKVNYSGVVLYESPRPPEDVQAAWKKLGREHHLAEDLPALGVDLVEVAQKDKNPAPRVEVELPVRGASPRATTIVLATRNGPVRRVNAVLRALELPAGVLALRAAPEPQSGKPRLEWALPAAGSALRLARLEVRRALNDPDDQIPAKEKEPLEAPFTQPVAEGATSFTDASAPDGVTFAYTLLASFESGADRFEVASAPASVRGGKPGGRLVLQATQARGVFGFKKPPVVELVVRREGGEGAFPAFQVVRALEGAKGEAVVAAFDGGAQPPGPLKDEDLAALTPGMTLVYSVKLARYLDARRVEVGSAAKVKLG